MKTILRIIDDENNWMQPLTHADNFILEGFEIVLLKCFNGD